MTKLVAGRRSLWGLRVIAADERYQRTRVRLRPATSWRPA